jgi:hypothetical protein
MHSCMYACMHVYRSHAEIERGICMYACVFVCMLLDTCMHVCYLILPVGTKFTQYRASIRDLTTRSLMLGSTRLHVTWRMSLDINAHATCLSVRICVSFFLFLFLSICLTGCFFFKCSSFFLSVCLSVCLFLWLSDCLSI